MKVIPAKKPLAKRNCDCLNYQKVPDFLQAKKATLLQQTWAVSYRKERIFQRPDQGPKELSPC